MDLSRPISGVRGSIFGIAAFLAAMAWFALAAAAWVFFALPHDRPLAPERTGVAGSAIHTQIATRITTLACEEGHEHSPEERQCWECRNDPWLFVLEGGSRPPWVVQCVNDYKFEMGHVLLYRSRESRRAVSPEVTLLVPRDVQPGTYSGTVHGAVDVGKFDGESRFHTATEEFSVPLRVAVITAEASKTYAATAERTREARSTRVVVSLALLAFVLTVLAAVSYPRKR